MKLHPILLATLLLGISSITHAEEPAVATQDNTLERLAKVEFYSFGGVGYTGRISQGEKDYVKILARPYGLNDFQTLLKIGTPQAKCYALVSLHALDKTVYENLALPYRNDKTQVAIMNHGCIVDRATLQEILKKIEAGAYAPTPSPDQ